MTPDPEIAQEIARLVEREIPRLEHDAKDYEHIRKQNAEQERRNG